jgi:hypothetical protein
MGDALLKTVIDSTGLPNDALSAELDRLIAKAGLEKQTITLDDMREILAEYLQDTLLELKSSSF